MINSFRRRLLKGLRRAAVHRPLDGERATGEVIPGDGLTFRLPLIFVSNGIAQIESDFCFGSVTVQKKER